MVQGIQLAKRNHVEETANVTNQAASLLKAMRIGENEEFDLD
jgi:hypothetical protein